MRADELGHAFELSEELNQAQQVVAHLEAMHDTDTVSVAVTNPKPGNVTIGSAQVSVGALLRCFKLYAGDLRTALTNYGVEL